MATDLSIPCDIQFPDRSGRPDADIAGCVYEHAGDGTIVDKEFQGMTRECSKPASSAAQICSETNCAVGMLDAITSRGDGEFGRRTQAADAKVAAGINHHPCGSSREVGQLQPAVVQGVPFP